MANENLVNEYTCDAGHVTVTVKVHKGTASFNIGCKQEGCDRLAQSCFSKCDQNQNATYEWYRPEWTEFQELHQARQEHVYEFGLLLRKKVP